ncbi:MAG: methionine synthase [Muribaculaceae bacterium]|nr:methionine synthase [Muribaculaceae bacterium]
MKGNDITKDIRQELEKRVLVLDGAMGTMIQRKGLTEDDFRGGLPVRESVKVKGNNDLLCLTRPDIIRDIHRAYIDAGADIIETNSFNANAISMSDYGLEGMVGEINRAAAELARAEADASGKDVFVAGSVGPSNVALSIAGADTDITFDRLSEAFREQCAALIEGGVDLILLETIFDTLNAKAAIAGARKAISESGHDVPLMISVTLTPQGRLISGQTLEAFVNSVSHADALTIGLNCSFGAEEMGCYLEVFADKPYYISVHPNAGLPDELGNYTETPEKMAATLGKYLDRGLLNIVGGCCGTTPAHIRAIAGRAHAASPRRRPVTDDLTLQLSGFDACDVKPGGDFLKVGERCNVAGSRKFLRLVNEGNLTEALDVAKSQIDKGAKVLDINMDDGMLDAAVEMEKFVLLLGADSVTSQLPLMIDSSDMEVIRRALRRIQGRPVVNSISLKEGEAAFLAHAREIRALGGAVVVMAFDENGQATTLERRIEICSRAYELLTEKGDFKGCDIIFDPNVLTIATGMPEHSRYAIDFLDATEWIKKHLPGAKVSGGVSNLSFAFRGHDKLRESIHTVFLHHAMKRGMDMAIVNPGTPLDIETVEPDLRELIEDLIFCRREDATDRLMEVAAGMKAERERLKGEKLQKTVTGRTPQGSHRGVTELIVNGIDNGLTALLEAELKEKGSAMAVVKETLMAAMHHVGDEFGVGRMFLPQVVRSATVMKRAIEYLTPLIESENGGRGESSGIPFVLATVKGDVHDIGKNILGVILRCSGFEVIDLGVMVEPERIISAIKENNAGFVGLSGLITPSLSEMCSVARMLESEGLTDVNLFVGGATTTDLHTAVKIAPLFSGLTIHTRDAAVLPPVAARLSDPELRDETIASLKGLQEDLRNSYARRCGEKKVPAKTTQSLITVAVPVAAPAHPGITDVHISVAELIPLINWKAFLNVWKLSPSLACRALEAGNKVCGCGCGEDKALSEARKLIHDADIILRKLVDEGIKLDSRVGLFEARRAGDDIIVSVDGGEVVFPMLRREVPPRISVADFLSEENDWLALFTVTARNVLQSSLSSGADDYESLMLQSLSDRLVEAATEWLHTYEHDVLHGIGTSRGIRPAIGYPSIPDQTLVHVADKLLQYSDLGITFTENGALSPSATTTGFIFAAPEARYFEVGDISEEQLADYARRRGLAPERLSHLLPRTS